MPEDRGRAARVAEAQHLRSQGLLQREIAERLGVGRTLVSAYLCDPDLSKQRRRRQRYRKPCPGCGTLMDGSGGYNGNQPKTCAACAPDAKRVWTAEAILEAILRWADEHDGQPPVATDWLYGNHGVNGDGYPYCPTVQSVFGTWNAAIETAGYTPYASGRKRSDAGYTDQIRDWLRTNGTLRYADANLAAPESKNPGKLLAKLLDHGEIERVAPGVYRATPLLR